MDKANIYKLINGGCKNVQQQAITTAAQIAVNETDFQTNELVEEHKSSSTHFLSMVYQDYYHTVVQYALMFRKIISIVKKYLNNIPEYDMNLAHFLVSVSTAYNDLYGANPDTDDENDFNYDDLEKNPDLGRLVEIIELYDAVKKICDTENISVFEACFLIRYTGMIKLYMIAYGSQIPEFVFKTDLEIIKKELNFLPLIEKLISNFVDDEKEYNYEQDYTQRT